VEFFGSVNVAVALMVSSLQGGLRGEADPMEAR
jgi:hypothetical protein